MCVFGVFVMPISSFFKRFCVTFLVVFLTFFVVCCRRFAHVFLHFLPTFWLLFGCILLQVFIPFWSDFAMLFNEFDALLRLDVILMLFRCVVCSELWMVSCVKGKKRADPTPIISYGIHRFLDMPGCARLCPVVPGCAESSGSDPNHFLTRQCSGWRPLARGQTPSNYYYYYYYY